MDLVQDERFVTPLKDLFYSERPDMLAIRPALAEIGGSVDMVVQWASEGEVFGQQRFDCTSVFCLVGRITLADQLGYGGVSGHRRSSLRKKLADTDCYIQLVAI